MRVGPVIRKYRAMTERNIRDVSKEIGISAATLSRVERGEEMDGETLARILKWLTDHPTAANVDSTRKEDTDE